MLNLEIMVKKIDKINIINAPVENRLDNGELLDIAGGDNCKVYDECWLFYDDTCTSYNTLACGGGGSDDLNCEKYTD